MNIPLTRTDMREFGGMASGYDPHDLQPGTMQYQNNLTTVAPGQLTCRRGYQLLGFTVGSLTAGNPVIAMYNFQASQGQCLVYHTTNNELRSGQI